MKQLLVLAVVCSTVFWSCRPIEYRVSREIVIDAPQKLVFEQVNNHKKRSAWSPRERLDPKMDKTFEGPQSGEGAIYKWSGNDSVGSGRLEIVESKPNVFIRSKLAFPSPFDPESTVEWHITNVNGATKAEWINIGSWPGYMFWKRGQDMEKQIAPQLEEGLKKLKEVCEENASTFPDGVLQTSVSSISYYYVDREVGFDEFNEDLFSEAYDEVYGYLGVDAGLVKEPPFAIYHEWNEENQLAKLEIGVAAKSEKPGNEIVKKDSTYSGKVVMRIYEGPYEGTEAVHMELNQYIQKNGMEIVGSPWESYVVGPADEPDPYSWVTEIYYPIAE